MRLNALRVLDAERLESAFHAERGTREWPGLDWVMVVTMDRQNGNHNTPVGAALVVGGGIAGMQASLDMA
ncbi:MAG: hypothetical protein GY943_31605, partial [Chloroflexi bacterium]|nr:hypothetical protein [Chloroflexota bacterium]